MIGNLMRPNSPLRYAHKPTETRPAPAREVRPAKPREKPPEPPKEIRGTITRRGEFITPDGTKHAASFGRTYESRVSGKTRTQARIKIGPDNYTGVFQARKPSY